MKEVGKSRQQTEGFGGGVSGSVVWCWCDGGVVFSVRCSGLREREKCGREKKQ